MWPYVKIPKAVALLAFLLPWMTVSCSNTKVAEANGWQLVTGNLVILTDLGGKTVAPGVNYYLAAALLLIAVGLVVALLRRRRPIVVLATTLLAMALTWLGASQYTPERIAAAIAKKSDGLGAGSIAGPMLRIDWQIGYWAALTTLAAAAVLAFLAIRDPDGG